MDSTICIIVLGNNQSKFKIENILVKWFCCSLEFISLKYRKCLGAMVGLPLNAPVPYTV